MRQIGAGLGLPDSPMNRNLQAFQRLFQVSLEVGEVLDPTAHSDHIVSDSQLLAGLSRDTRVGHDCGMFDEALHSTEALRESEDPEIFQERAGFLESALEVERDHSTETGHLFFRQLVLRVRGEAWVDHFFDLGMFFQESRDRAAILVVAFHAEMQGLETAHDQETIHRSRDCTDRVLVELEALIKVIVIHDDRSADHVAMAVHVFRHRVNDQVRAIGERFLEKTAHERVVDDGDHVFSAGDGREFLDVDELERWVRRRLHPEEFRVRADGFFQVFGFGQIDIVELQSHRLENLVEYTEGTSVDVIAADDVVAWLEEVENAIVCRESGREGEGVLATFERGQALLIGGTSRVVGARVLVTRVFTRRALSVGARLKDRRHDGARAWLRRLSRVNGQGTESEFRVRFFHGGSPLCSLARLLPSCPFRAGCAETRHAWTEVENKEESTDASPLVLLPDWLVFWPKIRPNANTMAPEQFPRPYGLSFPLRRPKRRVLRPYRRHVPARVLRPR